MIPVDILFDELIASNEIIIATELPEYGQQVVSQLILGEISEEIKNQVTKTQCFVSTPTQVCVTRIYLFYPRKVLKNVFRKDTPTPFKICQFWYAVGPALR